MRWPTPSCLVSGLTHSYNTYQGYTYVAAQPDFSSPYDSAPPHSIESEQSFLGAVMLNPEAISGFVDQIHESDFYLKNHQLLWRAIVHLYQSESDVDPVSISDWMQSHEIRDSHYVMEIAASTPSAANVATYAAIVREKSALRQIIDAGTEAVREAMNPGSKAEDVSLSAMNRMADISSRAEPSSSMAMDPIDVFGTMTPPDISAEWLPPGIAKYAFERAELIGTHPSIVAMSCLVACASVTDDRIVLKPQIHNDKYVESARLWAVIIGDPSIKKTPGIMAALSHLRGMDSADAEASIPEQADYQRKLKVYLKAESKWVKESAESHGSPLDPPEAPTKPPSRRIVVQDATIEALADVLMDNPGGVMYFKDEISGWFGGMDAYKKSGAGGVDRPLWLEAYNGGKRPIDRVSRGKLIVPNWSACVIGGVQPDKMASIADKMDDDGLIQRFMPVLIQNDSRESVDRPVDKETAAKYYRLLESLRDTKPSENPVQYTDDAREIWRELTKYARRLIECNLIPTMLRSHLGKWEGLFNRLALTYHCIRSASNGVHPTANAIDAVTASRVDNLMRKFLLPHAITFYSETLGRGADDRAAKAVAELILARRWKRVSRRDLTQYCQVFRKATEFEQRRCVRFLIDAGWLIAPAVIEKDPKSWAVNPKVHSQFASKAGDIEERRRANAEAFIEIRKAFETRRNSEDA